MSGFSKVTDYVLKGIGKNEMQDYRPSRDEDDDDQDYEILVSYHLCFIMRPLVRVLNLSLHRSSRIHSPWHTQREEPECPHYQNIQCIDGPFL